MTDDDSSPRRDASTRVADEVKGGGASGSRPLVSGGRTTVPGNVPVDPLYARPGHSQPRPLPDVGAMLGDATIDDNLLLGRVSERLFGSSADAQVGRFVIERRLGVGGMGVVYMGRDPDLHRAVAIKHLHPRFRTEQGLEMAQRRMRREARAMARIGHPNVVQIHEVGTHRGQLYLAMEFVDGCTLTEWLAGAARPRDEIVRTFCLAGEGLRAAHDAGLVHRDFKPDNVLISSAGVVKVTDFGLASAIRDVEGGANELLLATTEPDIKLSRSRASLTHTGAVMGTPLYMSPEQFGGQPVDASSDQFSFCVALYEALVGAHPYPCEDYAELSKHVIRGRLAPRPSGHGVPDWILTVLERGLQPDPAARWPAMEALLAALRDDPIARRRRWLARGGVAVVALSGVGVYGYNNLEARAERATAEEACERAGAAIYEEWSDEARASLVAAGQPGAERMLDLMLPELDRYAAQWSEARRGACLTTLDGRWTSALGDAAEACLDEHRWSLEALLSATTQEDFDLIGGLHVWVSDLPRPTQCLNRAMLERRPQLPDEPERRAEIRAYQHELIDISALTEVGRGDQALARTKEIQREVAALGWAPLEAEAAYALGELHSELGDFDEGERVLKEAYFAAGNAGADTIFIDAAVSLCWVVGVSKRRYREGLEWGKTAIMLMNRSGVAADDVAHIYPLGPMAILHTLLGEYDEAEATFRREIALSVKALGSQHPTLSSSYNNLAGFYLVRRRFDEAASYYQRALEIAEGSYGPDDLGVTAPLLGLGWSAMERGEFEPALEYARRALAVRETAYGKDHPDVAECRYAIGDIYSHKGDYALAEVELRRALEIYREADGPDSPWLVELLVSLGDMYRNKGDPERARAQFEVAVTIAEKHFEPTSDELLPPLRGLGEALAETEPARAVTLLERAMEICGPTCDPESSADIHFALARALWPDPAQHARARTLAERAQREYARASREIPRRARVDAWLNERASDG